MGMRSSCILVSYFVLSSLALPSFAPSLPNADLVSRQNHPQIAGQCGNSTSLPNNATMIPVPNFGFTAFELPGCHGMAQQIPAYPDVNQRTPKIFYYGDSKPFRNFSSFLLTRDMEGNEQLDFSNTGMFTAHNGVQEEWICGTFLYTVQTIGYKEACIDVDPNLLGGKGYPQCARVQNWGKSLPPMLRIRLLTLFIDYCLNEPEMGGTWGSNSTTKRTVQEPVNNLKGLWRRSSATWIALGGRMAGAVQYSSKSLWKRVFPSQPVALADLVEYYDD